MLNLAGEVDDEEYFLFDFHPFPASSTPFLYALLETTMVKGQSNTVK